MSRRRTSTWACKEEHGLALVLVLLATALLSALGLALALGTAAEGTIADHYRNAIEARAAADGLLEHVVQVLDDTADWGPFLQGVPAPGLTDGGPAGPRPLADGAGLDLGALTSRLNCGRPTACSAAAMDAVTPDRPWGVNNPRWTLFAHRPVSAFLPGGAVVSPLYVAAWIADDPAENDGDPTVDGRTPDNPGTGRLLVRAEAYGARGTRWAVEARVVRVSDQADRRVRVVGWREVH